MKKAILFGATGFIGTYLLQELLNDNGYDSVTVVVRRELAIQHPKLTVLTGDLDTLPNLADKIQGDDVFITFGTTRKQDPDYRIDYSYPLLAAKIARENGAKNIYVVTAVGADPNAKVLYTRTKGKIERDIVALGFNETHFFRAPLLTGDRKENRPMEKWMIALWMLIDPFFVGNKLNRYKGINGREVAKAMIRAAKKPSPKLNIYHRKEMMDLNRIR